MTTHLWVLAVALAVTAVFDWRSVLRGDVVVERVTKPLVVLLLMGLATSLYWEGHALDSPRLLPVLVALGLSLVGDVALLHATEARFLVGLGAFLLAHVAYVIAIVETGGPDGFPWWLLAAVPALLLLHARVGRAIVRGASPDRGPVLLYELALSVLVLVAAWHGDWLVLLGAAVFAVSDAVLGHDRFVRERRWAPLTVIVTYHVAQTLVVVGLFR
ncbi:lysoplasmalogenase [Terrabacter sp. NPDC000476]|uniref:lysoplasmalogenase n=1 Tax=Terrabacter sp. NPDC000476 TaxID=3154258 RepID=UPI00332F0548